MCQDGDIGCRIGGGANDIESGGNDGMCPKRGVLLESRRNQGGTVTQDVVDVVSRIEQRPAGNGQRCFNTPTCEVTILIAIHQRLDVVYVYGSVVAGRRGCPTT